MWLELRRERKAYYDAAKLVQKTTWIESCIEDMGGTGGGVWKKFKAISHGLPQGLEEKIIRVAEVRNSAVHDNPQIENIEKVFIECQQIRKVLDDRKYLDVLGRRIDKSIKVLKKSSGSIDALSASTQQWVKDVKKQQKRCMLCGKDEFKKLMSGRRKHFFMINLLTKWHNFLNYIVKKKWIIIFIILSAITITLFFKVVL